MPNILKRKLQLTSEQDFKTVFKNSFHTASSTEFLKSNRIKKAGEKYLPKNYKEKVIFNSLAKNFNLQNLLSVAKVNHIIIIGAGGTTSWFLPKLIKILNIFSDFYFAVTIVDGDVVELKNLTRQNYIEQDIGKYKAEVLATRYSNLIKDSEKISISFINKYVYQANIPERFEEFKEDFINFDTLFSNSQMFNDYQPLPIIFNLVDNEGVKKDLDLYFSTKSWGKALYFSAGVNLHNGQIYTNFYIQKYVQNNFLYNCYSKDHYQYLEDYDTLSLGCAEATQEEIIEDQLINGNDIVASTLATAFFNAFYSYPTYKFINLTFSPASPLVSEVKEDYFPLFLMATNRHHVDYFVSIPQDFRDIARILFNKIFYSHNQPRLAFH